MEKLWLFHDIYIQVYVKTLKTLLSLIHVQGNEKHGKIKNSLVCWFKTLETLNNKMVFTYDREQSSFLCLGFQHVILCPFTIVRYLRVPLIWRFFFFFSPSCHFLWDTFMLFFLTTSSFMSASLPVRIPLAVYLKILSFTATLSSNIFLCLRSW